MFVSIEKYKSIALTTPVKKHFKAASLLHQNGLVAGIKDCVHVCAGSGDMDNWFGSPHCCEERLA